MKAKDRISFSLQPTQGLFDKRKRLRQVGGATLFMRVNQLGIKPSVSQDPIAQRLFLHHTSAVLLVFSCGGTLRGEEAGVLVSLAPLPSVDLYAFCCSPFVALAVAFQSRLSWRAPAYPLALASFGSRAGVGP